MPEETARRTLRRLLFTAPVLSRALVSGGFRSVFRGRGIEFDALRDYDAEDDARLIDSRATARFGRAFVRTYREDRNLTVLLILDESRSMLYGTGRTRRRAAGTAAALLAYAAALNGTSVGAIFFDTEGISYVPPRAGRRSALTLTGRLSSEDPAGPTPRDTGARTGRGAGLAGALEAARALLKRRSLIFVLSDFRSAAGGPSGYSAPLGRLAARHDLVVVRVTDPSDAEPPGGGASAEVFDAETARPVFLSLGSKGLREAWSAFQGESRLDCLRALRSSAASFLELDTRDDPGKALVAFFERRRRGR